MLRTGDKQQQGQEQLHQRSLKGRRRIIQLLLQEISRNSNDKHLLDGLWLVLLEQVVPKIQIVKELRHNHVGRRLASHCRKKVMVPAVVVPAVPDLLLLLLLHQQPQPLQQRVHR